ncbi:NepR family anti-sigma factor [Hoeflea ulvae]|uniref:NepR family anti-sigma factor n=1 Tax=Hoeflea ulvae TaxID=2983764 RepID=A0ABT3YH98_9HYPH|nr:NepR family anti-sigma factor [Hoeflea ulvae]MCY0095278.1 NepR family anti-sigma factor [Hoeflea ulvae]
MIEKSNKGGANPADRGTTDAIGSQLKRYYKSVEQEPIPDQLLDLLEKLDQAERSGGKNGAN